ncbi:MAG TPA: YrhA family protein [Buttiauxella sp.]|nr:YrhA family protein [Buttiauxella sp.]
MKEINVFNALMVANNYPVAKPIAQNTMADLIRNSPPSVWDANKKSAYTDVQRLLITRQDYAHMFELMDGLEYNGLTFYGLAQAENGESLWSNIFIRNFDVRKNDIYVDPNLSDKVVIGEDGISVFTYSFAADHFEIRDRVSTDYVIETHDQFSDFLSAALNTVK